MPFVDIKLFEGRLTPETTPALIGAVTEAFVSVFGEGVREATWVTLTEVPRENWGIGGDTQE